MTFLYYCVHLPALPPATARYRPLPPATTRYRPPVAHAPTVARGYVPGDEFDVVAKRVKNDKSSGELGAWLSLWNGRHVASDRRLMAPAPLHASPGCPHGSVGGTLWKNTGQINVGVHHIFSNVYADANHRSHGLVPAPKLSLGALVRRFALGQFALAYELGCDEDANGRGFAPRYVRCLSRLPTLFCC